MDKPYFLVMTRTILITTGTTQAPTTEVIIETFTCALTEILGLPFIHQIGITTIKKRLLIK